MKICIYGASNNNIDKVYLDGAFELGKIIGERGHSIVFGGGQNGMMGACARGVHENGGSILGIAPKFFDLPGVLYEDCTNFIFTETMSERKHLLETNSDAFVILPGGNGTMDEFFETYTLKTLGILGKPIVIFNINGYYDPLLEMIKKSDKEGFLRPNSLELFRTFTDPLEMIEYLENDI